MNKSLLIYTINLLYIAVLLFGCSDESINRDGLFYELDSERTNVHFSNIITEDHTANAFVYEYIHNGGGVAIGDINNDGLEDIYFISNFDANKLYLNKGGLNFEDITNAAGASGQQGWSTGVSMIDINNDGLLDIYICKSGPLPPQYRKNELLINKGLDKNGIPTYSNEAEIYGIDNSYFSIQAAFFDFDLDGDLDMYLMNHNGNRLQDGELEKGSKIKSPLGDKFYVREGDKYIDRTNEVGIYSNSISYGLGIGISDLNNDGWPDMYISNDYEEYDYMYINQRDGTFKEVVKSATNHISNSSMGNDIADYDNDGYTDIVVLDMVPDDNYGMKTSMAGMSIEDFSTSVESGRHYQYMYNTLLRNSTYVDKEGTPHYSEVGHLAGISNTDWSWGPLLADFDNDGLKDLFITNGIKRDFRDKDFIHTIIDYMKQNRDAFVNPKKTMYLVNQTPTRPKANYIFKNNGNLKFENYSTKWFDRNVPGYSNGAAYADLDNDGDLDLVINNVDAEASILENKATNFNSNNFIKFHFKGKERNIQGIGTKVSLYTKDGRQVYENYPVRGYQSSKPANVHIGLKAENVLDSLIITWPDGQIEKLHAVELNKTYFIDYKNSNNQKAKANKVTKYFTLHNNYDSISHQENEYDDYQQQVLLPHKLSQFGPAMAVGDIDGDGLDDFYVGNATGFASKIYHQLANGEFILSNTFDQDKNFEDTDAVFFDYDQDGDLDLYVVSGGNEFESGSGNYRDRLYENENGIFKLMPELLPDIKISGSSVRIADYNNDGFNDIFVGGRHDPQNYPSPVSSYLLKNTNGMFEDVTQSVIPGLVNIGMVTDAEWADYDNDGDLDIMIVGEWMSPMLFENTNGLFTRNESAIPDFIEGWYFAVEPIDVDNDGDLDYLLGNLGSNYKYNASQEEPFEIYYADFDNNGAKDIVLGYYNFGELYPLRGKDCSIQQVPQLGEKIATYDIFGSSTLEEVYSPEALKSAMILKSYNFKSGLLLNGGKNNFQFMPFPALAQVSSINDFMVMDINKDGFKDVILAGNLFVSEIETPRNDAGYGMVLLNDKRGGFKVVDAHKSGFFVPYDVKNINEIIINNSPYLFVGANGQNLTCFEVVTN